MDERQRPKDDRELEQMTGIRPADHAFVSRDTIAAMEKNLLGPEWFRPRPKKTDSE